MKLVCDCGNEESFDESLNVIAERKRADCSGKMKKFKFNISSFRYIHFNCNVCGKKIRVYNKW